MRGIADFDGDGGADILWRLNDRSLRMLMQPKAGNTLFNAVPSRRNVAGHIMGPEWDVKTVGDFNGDGYADIAWRRDDGTCLGQPCSKIVVWWMVGSIYTAESVEQGAGRTTQIVGTGDFDADGKSDVLWRRADGALVMWLEGSDQRGAFPSWKNSGISASLDWQIRGIADFNTDGRADILWRHDDGTHSVWLMSGASWIGEVPPFFVDTSWSSQGVLPR